MAPTDAPSLYVFSVLDKWLQQQDAPSLYAFSVSDEWQQQVLAVKQVPDVLVVPLYCSFGEALSLQCASLDHQEHGEQAVRANHERLIEPCRLVHCDSSGKGIVGKKKTATKVAHTLDTQPRGEGLNVELFVTLDVGQVLGDGDNHRENGNERRDEKDGGAPHEGQADCCRGCMVHAKVEQQPSHGGDDEERRHCRALEAKRGYAVDGAQEQTQAVQLGD
mmetsp:Transcript_8606/g.21400  ORF Transcript_8606/g.21400 Transcript_8606/m.21400 type:complete len:220 (-) Transcript_8606:944-1603(-)